MHRSKRGETPLARFYRENILEHDPCCAYCGSLITLENPRNIDHIDPTISGGTGEWDNLTNACQSCNLRKARKSLLIFLLELHQEQERMAA